MPSSDPISLGALGAVLALGGLVTLMLGEGPNPNGLAAATACLVGAVLAFAVEALLRRRNVTHAAQDVGLSQPAMSRALSRLRILLADPLLVRGHHGLVLTPKAQALGPLLSVAVADLKNLFRERRFDPATEQRTIRIAASDNQTVLLAPPLMVMTLLVARNPRVMGRLVLPLPVAALGWVATGVMVLAGVGFLVS